MPIAKVNGININYKVEGQGETLVMLMGFQLTRSGWMSQTRFFKKYYQVVTFDNRGVGKSDKPDGPYSTRMMADDTIGLMDHLSIQKAHILGVSMGGMIAQELAINYPERVAKLILVGTFACQDESCGNTAEWAKALELPIRKMGSTTLTLMFNKPLYRMIFVPLMSILGRRTGTTGLLGQREAMMGHNAVDRLPLIKTPTLVIVGTKDRVIRPTSSEVLAEKIPNAKLVKIDNGSHALSAEMSRTFNRKVLNFLKNS
jgi:pimeloyl-ACP methyl ester carboxylesterase